MKLSNGADLTAVLADERKDVFVIDFDGNLILSRNNSAAHIAPDTTRCHLKNALFIMCWNDTNRFTRFWTFAKAAWRFSK